MAIPVTVIEDNGVFDSFGRSWCIAKSRWVRISVIHFLAITPKFVAAVTFTPYLEDVTKYAMDWTRTAIKIFGISLVWLSVTVSSVCYSDLREIEDNRNAEPASTVPD